jgi:hypothetical protein
MRFHMRGEFESIDTSDGERRGSESSFGTGIRHQNASSRLVAEDVKIGVSVLQIRNFLFFSEKFSIRWATDLDGCNGSKNGFFDP